MAADDEPGIAPLRAAMTAALDYASSIDDRRVTPDADALAALRDFDEPLPLEGADDLDTVALLHRIGSPATMATTGARYFGFVNGATLPAALATAWLGAAWDQNAALPAMSPVATKLHAVVRGWLLDALRLPPDTGVAFVSGATVANASCLAAARDALLARQGWDVQADGLFGAPELRVVIGERAHSTLSKSLGLVGLGRERVTVVPADEQGRLRADRLPDLDGPVLVCAQAGEVNTGSFDPFDEIADWLAGRSGWLHVDGAFGLWALADPSRAHLVRGLDRADSWATDGHKWLNVTYDCGIAFVRHVADLRRTFAVTAGYLPASDAFEAMHHTPQSSQRARQIEVWAVLRTLGRRGLAELVVRACDAAAAIAERLRDGGLTVLNDVVLNQVLVRLVDGPTTERLITEIQADGRVWCGPTQWDGATAMRISVSSWKTDLDDAAFAADAILDCAAQVERRRADRGHAGGMADLMGVHHVALTVRDLEASARWYGEVLGCEELFREDGEGRRASVMRFAGGGHGVALVEHGDSAGVPFDPRRTGLDHVAFTVGTYLHIEEWAARLSAAGVDHSGVIDIPPGAILNFKDPDGIGLALFWERA